MADLAPKQTDRTRETRESTQKGGGRKDSSCKVHKLMALHMVRLTRNYCVSLTPRVRIGYFARLLPS